MSCFSEKNYFYNNNLKLAIFEGQCFVPASKLYSLMIENSIVLFK